MVAFRYTLGPEQLLRRAGMKHKSPNRKRQHTEQKPLHGEIAERNARTPQHAEERAETLQCRKMLFWKPRLNL